MHEWIPVFDQRIDKLRTAINVIGGECEEEFAQTNARLDRIEEHLDLEEM